MNYENWKILQSEYSNHQDEYEEVSNWCSETNQYFIDDSNGIYYKVKKIPSLTVEELQENIRRIRNKYLENTDKYMLPDFPITEEERQKYIQYRQYLRDYTNNIGWWKYEPKTFEEWDNTNES